MFGRGWLVVGDDREHFERCWRQLGFADAAFELVDFDGTDAAIERDPAHDLRVGEVLRIAANFPDALVRTTPHLLQVLEDRAQEVPIGRPRLQAAAFALKEGVDDFAEHVELKLSMCGIADPHWRRLLVAW